MTYLRNQTVFGDTATAAGGQAGVWEQDGSGGTLSNAVRRGHRARLDSSDVQECLIAAGLLACVLSSGRRGHRFKSGHPTGKRQVTRHLVACHLHYAFPDVRFGSPLGANTGNGES